MGEDKSHVIFIDISLVEWALEVIPDHVIKVNDYTYDIFDVRFIVPGEKISLIAMVEFLMDNGWFPDDEDDTE